MKLGLIGCGRMGGALIQGALEAGIIQTEHIFLSSRTRESADKLAVQTGGSVCENNLKVVQQCDLVLLGCKPYQVLDILAELNPAIPGKPALVSIAAGITLSRMQSACPEGTRLIRAMPNTPSMIGMGATGITAGSHATEADMNAARTLLQSVGIVVTVTEPQLDAVTGVSGSGPAYVYTMIKALADQGVAEGLATDDALRLAARTALGAAHMVEQTKKSPQELIDQVTSPGGTTMAGLAKLAEHEFEKDIAAAVHAGTERSREIARES